MSAVFLLSMIVFLPAIATLGIMLIPSEQKEAIRWTTLAVTAVTMILILGVLIFGYDAALMFKAGEAGLQSYFNYPWIPSFQIDYFMGLDGISFPLLVLTAFVCLLAMGASWSITKYVKGYCILFLLLETGMLGVFVALDLFLFYVFWEVMLLPMYFLIGVWGGPRKEYAAIKFFLYTLFGSVLMLIAILMLYFSSDLSDPLLMPHLDKCYLNEVAKASAQASMSRRIANEVAVQPVHTFNIMALAQIGQHTGQFDGFGQDPETLQPILFLGHGLQWWAFLLLFIGFAIKVPSVPVHTWLPDAHVEAPTPISMILAGVLLKMGGYGILRICYPICPAGGYELMWFVCTLGVVSMIYGAFSAMAQTDFKRLVAYSSVSHMGYVVLGLGVWSALARNGYSADYWNMGVQGAMFQMIAHGISSTGMFFIVGVLYDRVHHRNLNEFGGIFGKMPYYTAMAMIIFFAGLGLPGLCGFIGEVFVVLAVWKFSYLLAVLSAAVVILTAGYILWAVQRVYLGPEYKGPHGDHLTPSNLRENVIGTVLCVFAIVFGVFPYQFPGGQPSILKYMDATIDAQVHDLADWTREEDAANRSTTAATAPTRVIASTTDH
ncbi:MAG TPA: NADH-quinone oxidoreductase subunit M [Pirellulaceae bacterium]|jgi:NADH-quinone oxidoreductase subunit M